MLNIQRALENDRLLRALTGLNRQAFDALCEVFGSVYQEALQSDFKPRKRARGGGWNARLQSMESKLFFILFYFKCYPTFDVLSVLLFDLERGRANRRMHRLQEILETALGRKMVLPERKLESIEQFLERFPAVKEVILDGTERPVQRPKDAEKQAHAGIKRYGAVAAVYRNRVPDFDAPSCSRRLACGTSTWKLLKLETKGKCGLCLAVKGFY